VKASSSANNSKSNIKLQWTILSVGSLLLILKFAAYFLTVSNTILSDAFESIINVSAAAFALFSLYYSAMPKDKNHPYGHGKIEFIAAGVEGVLIVGAGLGIIYKSVYNFFFPLELHDLDIGIVLVSIAGLANYIMGHILEKRGREQKILVLESGGKHLKTDAYSSLALLIGLFAIYILDLPILDSVFAIIFGLYIGFEGYKIIRKSIAGIMDEADFELLDEIIELLNQKRETQWIDIHNLRVIKYGSVIHIDAHLTVPYYLTVQEGHAQIDKLEEIVREEFGTSVELFLHVDPCIESSCPICPVADCKVRKHPFKKRLDWDSETVLENQKHEAEMIKSSH